MERTLVVGGWEGGGSASSAGYLHAEQLLMGLNTIWPIQTVLSGVKAPLNLRQPHKTPDPHSVVGLQEMAAVPLPAEGLPVSGEVTWRSEPK